MGGGGVITVILLIDCLARRGPRWEFLKAREHKTSIFGGVFYTFPDYISVAVGNHFHGHVAAHYIVESFL